MALSLPALVALFRGPASTYRKRTLRHGLLHVLSYDSPDHPLFLLLPAEGFRESIVHHLGRLLLILSYIHLPARNRTYLLLQGHRAEQCHEWCFSAFGQLFLASSGVSAFSRVYQRFFLQTC